MVIVMMTVMVIVMMTVMVIVMVIVKDRERKTTVVLFSSQTEKRREGVLDVQTTHKHYKPIPSNTNKTNDLVTPTLMTMMMMMILMMMMMMKMMIVMMSLVDNSQTNGFCSEKDILSEVNKRHNLFHEQSDTQKEQISRMTEKNDDYDHDHDGDDEKCAKRVYFEKERLTYE